MTRVPRRLALGVAMLLATPVLAACGGEGTGAKGYVAGDGGIFQVEAADRKPVGDVAGTTLDGDQVSVAELGRGKPVVLNVWGSWCAPCRKEAPLLAAASKDLGSKAAFLGIDIRDAGAQDRAKAFERRFDVPYPSLYDPDGRSLLELPGGLATRAIPSTVVLDSQGRVAATVVGPVPSARTLVDLVEDAR